MHSPYRIDSQPPLSNCVVDYRAVPTEWRVESTVIITCCPWIKGPHIHNLYEWRLLWTNNAHFSANNSAHLVDPNRTKAGKNHRASQRVWYSVVTTINLLLFQHINRICIAKEVANMEQSNQFEMTLGEQQIDWKHLAQNASPRIPCLWLPRAWRKDARGTGKKREESACGRGSYTRRFPAAKNKCNGVRAHCIWHALRQFRTRT